MAEINRGKRLIRMDKPFLNLVDLYKSAGSQFAKSTKNATSFNKGLHFLMENVIV